MPSFRIPSAEIARRDRDQLEAMIEKALAREHSPFDALKGLREDYAKYERCEE